MGKGVYLVLITWAFAFSCASWIYEKKQSVIVPITLLFALIAITIQSAIDLENKKEND